jgi:hypothetical protein
MPGFHETLAHVFIQLLEHTYDDKPHEESHNGKVDVVELETGILGIDVHAERITAERLGGIVRGLHSSEVSIRQSESASILLG